MLQLKNIVKNYGSGGNLVRALRGVSLQFRHSDFVCILGPSGCGKTTLLNIIGGLDQATGGDLLIDGYSTKGFKDRDWDTYRNHSIGFVFQNYNLIPHQSVLQNVELALTLSGVSKRERRQRAKQALERVGLADQLRKRPSQMSGGQMQRVAIARALVNDPEIILADEPTGALDTETSVQVMDILKEVSKERLVVMVTHNPDLANKYATRTIRMLDGNVISDSAPLNEEERTCCREEEQRAIFGKKRRVRKPSMSWATSFGLSLKNLFSKKGRTTLTAFAGSIGIIGIALIFAVSNGMTTYINAVQEDTLSSYPLTLEATTVDVGTLMRTFMGLDSEEDDAHDLDAVYSQSVMADMINALNNLESTENDLKAFKAYLQKEMNKPENGLSDALTGIQYTYNMDLLVYTKDTAGNIIYSDTEQMLTEALRENMGMDMSAMMGMQENMTGMSSTMMMPGMQTNLWCEILSGKDGKPVNPVVEDQYDVIYGSWPNSYDEIVLVVDKNNEIDDMTMFAMGLESHDKIKESFDAILDGGEIDTTQKKWTYEEICAKEYRVVLNGDCFKLDENTGLYADLRESEAGLRYLYDNALTLKITGIIRPSEKASSTMLSGSIAYTKALTEYVAEKNAESVALKAQKEQPGTDVFTGLPFKDDENLSDADKETAFRKYVAGLTVEEQAKAYVKIMGIPSEEQLSAMVDGQMAQMDRTKMEQTMIDALSQQAGMNVKEMEKYILSMSDEDLEELFRQMLTEQVKQQYALQVQQQTAGLSVEQLAGALQMVLPTYTTEQCAVYYGEILEFAETTYEENLRTLSDVDLEDPATINLYASSFENKDVLEEVIAEYNKSVEELKQIRYTDYVGIMMSSITTIINAITYVLIAFVAISLVVSSIMIGVITLISVQERTKEIGILRAIGASKRNVSGMFNAETVMIGLASGLLGVGVTYGLCVVVNIILFALTDIANLKAVLPVEIAVVLVLISMLLTLFAGIIPSRSAAKKDPVVALRTE